jgi:FkbM family methyltransferase
LVAYLARFNAVRMAKLSVILITRNESAQIVDCLESVWFADEWIVVDCGSSDDTVELARNWGAKVYVHSDWKGFGKQKNRALDYATGDWVLSIDADERVTPELAGQIQKVIEDAAPADGYTMPRLSLYCGKFLRHGGWWPDRVLRLFRRGRGRFSDRLVHECVELHGNVQKLEGHLVHYTYPTSESVIEKMNSYSSAGAESMRERGRRGGVVKAVMHGVWAFVRGYIFRAGFLDGRWGFLAAVSNAENAYYRYVKCWLLERGVAQGAEMRPRNRCQIRHASLPHLSTSQSARNRMNLRQFRQRMVPAWLRPDARRKLRNIVFRRLGIQRCYSPPILTREPSLIVRSNLRYVVAYELLQNPRMTFLQIGAFDGVGDDDLREIIMEHRLRGVLIEPQPAAFAKLRTTYKDQPQVTLLQAAIAEREGTRTFYCRRNEAATTASFDRNHLLKHGVPDREIVAEQVPCHTVESALRTAGMPRADLIQIDAEGYDWPIIRSIDFARLRPRILRFEYRHMPARDADACLSFLASHGYRFMVERLDIIALVAGESDRAIAA